MSTTTDVLSLFKYDPVADADSTFNITQGLNNNWDKIDTAILLAIAAAGAYNPEESYAVGDYCTYKGKLRKCSTAIPTGETWTETHWTTTTVAAELAELSSQLSNLESALTTPPQKFDLPLSDGWYTNDRAQYRKTQEGLAVVNAILELSEGYDASDNTQIAVLPEGFRPATSFMYPVSVQDGSTRASAIVQIGTSGTIIYYGASNTTAVFRIYLNAAFFAAS